MKLILKINFIVVFAIKLILKVNFIVVSAMKKSMS